MAEGSSFRKFWQVQTQTSQPKAKVSVDGELRQLSFTGNSIRVYRKTEIAMMVERHREGGRLAPRTTSAFQYQP